MVFEALHVFMHLAEEDNLKKGSQMHQGGILRHGGGGEGPMQDGENQQQKTSLRDGILCRSPSSSWEDRTRRKCTDSNFYREMGASD